MREADSKMLLQDVHDLEREAQQGCAGFKLRIDPQRQRATVRSVVARWSTDLDPRQYDRRTA